VPLYCPYGQGLSVLFYLSFLYSLFAGLTLNMSLSRYKVELLINDEADSTPDDDTESLFDKSDNSTDNEEWLFDDEERHLLEYYLSEVVTLDVTRLWQRRYSLRT
jgi:hypothetical protein